MTDPEDPPAPQPAVRSWQARVRWAVLIVGFVGLVVVMRQALDNGQQPFPSPLAAVAALIVYTGAGLASAHAWAVLLGPQVDRPAARAAMYTSQLSKYVPGGGVVQAAGQVALSATAAVPVRRVALAWATSIVLTVVAGTTMLGVFALTGGLSGWPRAAAGLGPLALLLVDRSRLAWVLVQARRLSRRVPDPALLPTPAEIRVALAWTLGNVVLSAGSFTIILVDLDPGLRPTRILSAFLAGWLVGFLLVPLPAGLGAREAIVVALIPGSTTGILLAASVSHRILALVAELLLVITNHTWRWWHRRRAPAGPPP